VISGQGLRVVIAGATGALAREVFGVLEQRNFQVSELVAFASAGSTGDLVSFCGEEVAVTGECPHLAGFDLLIICTPAGPALDLVRESLRAEVCCIDCSGALADSPDVPLLVSGLCAPSSVIGAPVITSPANPSLAWSLVVGALDAAAGVTRVVGTVLQSASVAGRAGIEALSGETLALLSQRDVPEPEVFNSHVAFDCLPHVGPPRTSGAGEPLGDETRQEASIVRDLQRLLKTRGSEVRDASIPVAATAIQVPTFVGEGSSLSIELERTLSVREIRDVLAKASGVELWDDDEQGPTTRDTAGRDVVLVSRVRPDPSNPKGLLLWCAADPLQLAATNAVKLAEMRLRLH
jgi:aspartate-semialdehyde dehydrogenase